MPLGGYALDGYFSMSKLGSRCVVTPLTTVTIPTVWLFCALWLALLAIYCRVLWSCPGRKAKSHKPLAGGLRHPALSS